MTMIENHYHPGWWEAKVDGVAMSPEEIAEYHTWQKEQSSHASVGHCPPTTSEHGTSAPRLDLPVTQEEDEFFERLTQLAGMTS